MLHTAVVCSLPELKPGAHLKDLKRLRDLSLIAVDLEDFDVPNAPWGRHLLDLSLKYNKLTRLPGNLSALTSLSFLTLEGQSTNLELVEPLEFLTQLRDLRIVHLSSAWELEIPWSNASRHFLMGARLLIKDTPRCRVELTDTQ